MAKFANPARRLHDVLAQMSNQSRNEPLLNVLGQVMGREGEHKADLLTVYFTLWNLVLETESAVRSMPDTDGGGPWMNCVAEIKQAIGNANPQAGWDQTYNQFGPVAMGKLDLVAERLGELGGEEAIPSERLQEIQNQVDELREAVLEDETLDPGLRQVIVRLAEKMHRAIVDYRLLGAEGIRDVVNECIGALFTNRERVEQSKQSASLKRFVEVVLSASKLVETAFKLKELAAPILKPLLEAAKHLS